MRNQIPEMTSERLSNRVSIWLLSAANGNEQATDRIETAVDVLNTVGFAPDIINDVLATAAKMAGVPAPDVHERFGVESRTPSVKRERRAKE